MAPSSGVPGGSKAEATVRALELDGASTAVVLRDGAPVGVLAFRDPMRPGVAEAVQALRRDGLSIALVTGDRDVPARSFAETAGITEVHSGLDPAGKLALVRRYQTEGRKVAVVGDGVNDAPALAAADLGVAIGSGTAVARETGQVVLVRPEFSGVAVALRIARRTVRKVRQNLAWALGYNAVLLPVAAGALVPIFGLAVYGVLPIAGAAAMAISSTLVIANSLTLRRAVLAGPSPA